jgi:hypothetical protein
MAKPKPKYDINDFFKACREENKNQSNLVVFEQRVRITASEDFSLKTKKALLQFIVYGGLEKLTFINSKEYKLSKEIPPPICDAYEFYSGFILGYISFFYSDVSKKWVIKSFHKSDKCGPTLFEVAFRKLEMLENQKKD